MAVVTPSLILSTAKICILYILLMTRDDVLPKLTQGKDMECVGQGDQQTGQVNKRKPCEQGAVRLVVQDTKRIWHEKGGNSDSIQ